MITVEEINELNDSCYAHAKRIWRAKPVQDAVRSLIDVHARGLGRVEIFKLCVAHIDLSGLDLRGAIFDGCAFTHVNFDGCDLTGAQFRMCLLDNVSFQDANLTDARIGFTGQMSGTISGATIDGATFLGRSFFQMSAQSLNLKDRCSVTLPTDGGVMIIHDVPQPPEPDMRLAYVDPTELAKFDGKHFLVGKGLRVSGKSLKHRDLKSADFSNSELRDCDFSFAEFGQVDITGSNWENVSFDGAIFGKLFCSDKRKATLRYVKFRGTKMFGSEFKHSDTLFSDCDFRNSDMSCSNFRVGTIRDCTFTNTNLSQVTFNGDREYSHTAMERCTFTDCNMNMALFRSVTVRACSFTGNDLTDVRLSSMSVDSHAGTFGPGNNFTGLRSERVSNYSHFDRKFAVMRDGNFLAPGVTVQGVKMRGFTFPLSMRGADLTGCDMSGNDLSDVDLRDAKLVNVNLRGACLRGVDLTGADLTGAEIGIDYDKNYTRVTIYDDQTKWPVGCTIPKGAVHVETLDRAGLASGLLSLKEWDGHALPAGAWNYLVLVDAPHLESPMTYAYVMCPGLFSHDGPFAVPSPSAFALRNAISRISHKIRKGVKGEKFENDRARYEFIAAYTHSRITAAKVAACVELGASEAVDILGDMIYKTVKDARKEAQE